MSITPERRMNAIRALRAFQIEQPSETLMEWVDELLLSAQDEYERDTPSDEAGRQIVDGTLLVVDAASALRAMADAPTLAWIEPGTGAESPAEMAFAVFVDLGAGIAENELARLRDDDSPERTP